MNITTSNKQEFIDITSRLAEHIDIKSGIMIVYCPHTTAGLTINEGADPDVKSDILKALETIIPAINYDHAEGNSPAHIKASMMGSSVTILIDDGKFQLGRWQSVFFCEFDGPRTRTVDLRCISCD